MPSADEALTAVFLLLPGFLVSMVYRAFYPAPDKSDFEKTLESLAFTLVVLIVYGLFGGRGQLISDGVIHPWTLLFLTAIAIAVGVVASIAARKELLQRCLRRVVGPGPAGGVDLYWRVLRDKTPTWILVYLKGQDCVLLGAPKYLDMGMENRSLFLTKARRLDRELRDAGLVQGPGVIVPLDEISMIEVYEPQQLEPPEQSSQN